MAERITGALKSFKNEKGLAHGYVRLKTGDLLHVAARERKVLNEDGSVRDCINGERYHAISPETPIVLEVEYDRDGKNPFVVTWAPKAQAPP